MGYRWKDLDQIFGFQFTKFLFGEPVWPKNRKNQFSHRTKFWPKHGTNDHFDKSKNMSCKIRIDLKLTTWKLIGYFGQKSVISKNTKKSVLGFWHRIGPHFNIFLVYLKSLVQAKSADINYMAVGTLKRPQYVKTSKLVFPV